MKILELAAFAGQKFANRNHNGAGSPAAASSSGSSAAAAPARDRIDADLLQVELAAERFFGNSAKPEDFFMEGES